MSGVLDSKYIRRDYECKGSISLINIISRSDGVNVTSGDVKNVQISYWENPGKYEYDLSEEAGRLVLSVRKSGSLLSGVHYTFKDTKIQLTVPKSFAGALALQCTSGEINVKDINTEYLKIECVSGSIKMSEINSRNEVTVINKTGSIKLSNISGTNVNTTNKSGSLSLEYVRADGIVNAAVSTGGVKMANIAASFDISVNNKSGTIDLDSISTEGSVMACNTSGGVHFDSLKAGGNITLKSTSGSVKGTIVGKESDYTIMANTKSGTNNLNSTSAGSKELNVKTTSGSIKIKFI